MMTKEDLNFVVQGVVAALEKNNLEKKNKTASEYFKEGLFRFIIPGVIVFLATFFALQRNFEIFKINTENRFGIIENDVVDLEKRDEKYEKSFEELAKDFYSTERSGNSENSGVNN